MRWSWKPLFAPLGLALLLAVALALVGTTVSLRAETEQFGVWWTGVVLAAYFVGLGLGGTLAGGLVARIGHVRAIAVLGSGLMAAVLTHAIRAHPGGWALIRCVAGFCAAGLYIAAESWLSSRCDDRRRGVVLAGYAVVLQLGGAAGHLLVQVSGASTSRPFIVAAILLSLASLPVLLVAPSHEPRRAQVAPLNLGATLAAAPVAMAGCVVAGVVSGAAVTLVPVYGIRLGLSVDGVARLMFALVLGGVVLQLPIGRLADRAGRARALGVIAACLGGASALALATGADLSPPHLLAVVALYGGFVFSLYPTAAVYTYERLGRDRALAAGGALLVVYAAGAAVGPILTALVMARSGPGGLFAVSGGAASLLAAVVILRRPLRSRMRASLGASPSAAPAPRARPRPAGATPHGVRAGGPFGRHAIRPPRRPGLGRRADL